MAGIGSVQLRPVRPRTSQPGTGKLAQEPPQPRPPAVLRPPLPPSPDAAVQTKAAAPSAVRPPLPPSNNIANVLAAKLPLTKPAINGSTNKNGNSNWEFDGILPTPKRHSGKPKVYPSRSSTVASNDSNANHASIKKNSSDAGIRQLKEQLKKAVAEEDFEQCVELKRRIKVSNVLSSNLLQVLEAS